MIVRRKYPYIARQTWKQIYFTHWRVDESLLNRYIPKPFTLDTFDGSAWLTVVCFLAEDSRLRFLPMPVLPSAIQINVRTYVTMDGHDEQGVYFFNLFVNSQLAVFGARQTFHLPFEYVHSTYIETDNEVGYHSKYGVGGRDMTIFSARFNQFKETFIDDADEELDKFLTERYCIWNLKRKRIIKIPILHRHWKLNRVNALIDTNELHPLIKNVQPNLIHYSDQKLSCLFPYESLGIIV